MIISRTPMRISFFGGGTDRPDFYRAHGWGAVLSATIDKYVYICINKKNDGKIRLSYSRTENVDRIEDVQHPLFRECMKYVGVVEGVEIVSVADVPAGSGLGSSSAFAVGLIKALFHYARMICTGERLAEGAAHVEIERLGQMIGRQDHYSAALGGCRLYKFMDEGVVVGYGNGDTWSEVAQAWLERRLMLFDTGLTHSSTDIHASATLDHETLLEMRDQAVHGKKLLTPNHADLDAFGIMLHSAWELKKRAFGNITTPEIDEKYQKALAAGALGGKICGAGQGGFMLFYCPPEHQDSVREVLRPWKEMRFKFEKEGSAIVYRD